MDTNEGISPVQTAQQTVSSQTPVPGEENAPAASPESIDRKRTPEVASEVAKSQRGETASSLLTLAKTEGINAAMEGLSGTLEVQPSDTAESEQPAEESTGDIATSEADDKPDQEKENKVEEERLLTECMQTFDTFIDRLSQFRVIDKKYTEDISQTVLKLMVNAKNGNPGELGYTNIVDAVEQTYSPIRSKLIAMSETAAQVGSNKDQVREQIRVRLGESLAQADKQGRVDTTNEVKRAIHRFVTTTNEQQQSQGQLRHTISITSEENINYARGLYQKINAYSNGGADRYEVATRYLRDSEELADMTSTYEHQAAQREAQLAQEFGGYFAKMYQNLDEFVEHGSEKPVRSQEADEVSSERPTSSHQTVPAES